MSRFLNRSHSVLEGGTLTHIRTRSRSGPAETHVDICLTDGRRFQLRPGTGWHITGALINTVRRRPQIAKTRLDRVIRPGRSGWQLELLTDDDYQVCLFVAHVDPFTRRGGIPGAAFQLWEMIDD